MALLQTLLLSWKTTLQGINMTDGNELILNEIKHLREDWSSMANRMGRMETALADLARQANQIESVTQRVTKLEQWNTSQGKELNEIAKFQGGCVRFTFDKVVEKQWTAIKVLAGAMMTGFGALITVMALIQ